MKIIKDFAYQTRKGEWRCRIDRQPCVPGESDCPFSYCLSKLLWGLTHEEWRGAALEELERFLGMDEDE